MGGKSGAKDLMRAGLYSDLQSAHIARQLWGESQPFRAAYHRAWGDILGGEMPFGEAGSTIMGAAREPIEAQYGMARRNVLETVPEGGRLEEALADVDVARAQGLQNVVATYLMDQLNKMYGAAFQAPQLSIAGLQGVGQHAVQTGTAASQAAAGACCFNFLEAEGEIHSAVRRYRDEHYPKNGRVGRGYLRCARVFVPLMQKYKSFKAFIRIIMTKPLKSYAQWFYGENRHGFIFRPIAEGWVNYWRLLGMGE